MEVSATAATAPEAFGVAVPVGQSRSNLECARLYLAALEAGPDVADAFRFVAHDIIQIEYPNQFVPNGAERDLDALRAAAARGARVLRGQRYEVRTAIAHGDEVALEVLWVGTLAVAIGTRSAGDEMRAHFGVFLSFRDGRIIRQRNYDCFDPF